MPAVTSAGPWSRWWSCPGPGLRGGHHCGPRQYRKLYTVAGEAGRLPTPHQSGALYSDRLPSEDPISCGTVPSATWLPTILDVMGLPQPLEMTRGRSLAEDTPGAGGGGCSSSSATAGAWAPAMGRRHPPGPTPPTGRLFGKSLLHCRLQASRELGAWGPARPALRGRPPIRGPPVRMPGRLRLDAAGAGRSFARNPVFLGHRGHARQDQPPCICWPTSPISPPTGASTIPGHL